MYRLTKRNPRPASAGTGNFAMAYDGKLERVDLMVARTAMADAVRLVELGRDGMASAQEHLVGARPRGGPVTIDGMNEEFQRFPAVSGIVSPAKKRAYDIAHCRISLEFGQSGIREPGGSSSDVPTR